MTEVPLLIESLSAHHRHESFDSGVPELDEFLKKHARQNEGRGISRTFVVIRGSDPSILGYCTLRMGAVRATDLPEEESRRLPRYPVPVVHLARLAIDRRVAGQGLGGLLLAHALEIALSASQSIGAYAVEVIAKSDVAREFYLKYGFLALRDDRLHLYLSMKTVRKLFQGPVTTR